MKVSEINYCCEYISHLNSIRDSDVEGSFRMADPGMTLCNLQLFAQFWMLTSFSTGADSYVPSY